MTRFFALLLLALTVGGCAMKSGAFPVEAFVLLGIAVLLDHSSLAMDNTGEKARAISGWISALCFLIAAAFFSACTAQAAPLNLTVYQERAIRLQESEGERNCWAAHGADGEIGCYQFKPETARQVGFDESGWRMWLPENQMAIAAEIIRRCAEKPWRYPARQIATCYHRGLKAGGGKGDEGFAYGQRVAMRYHAALLARERNSRIALARSK